MAENPKIKKIKLSDTTYDLDIGYSNEKGSPEKGGARYTVGGLPQGFDLSKEMSVRQILDKIFFPFTQMTVGNATASPSPTTYTIPNYPTLNTVSIPITQNDTTGLQFSLYDITTSPHRLVKGPLTEDDLESSKLIFKDLTESSITTPRTYQIRYTYLKEDGSRSSVQSLNIGKFDLAFTPPTSPKVRVVGIAPDGTTLDASGTTTYKVGQSCTVNKITTTVDDLYSAIGDDGQQGINSFSLTKSHDDKFSQSSSANEDKKSCEFTLASAETLAPTHETITAGSALYTYSVTGKYNKRTKDNSTWTTDGGTTSQGSATVKFDFIPAGVSLSGISTSTKSKLEPITISSNTLKATLTKNSDQVNSVELVVDGTTNQTIDFTTGSTKDGDLTKTAYDTTGRLKEFSYATESEQPICSTTTFQAKANCKSGTKSSNTITLTYKAPYCYGWVTDEDLQNIGFNDIDRNVLAKLANQELSETTYIELTGGVNRRFIYAVPNGAFTSAKDGNGGLGDENFDLFDTDDGTVTGSRNKLIKFADGSEVTYQILTFKTGNNIQLTFRK